MKRAVVRWDRRMRLVVVGKAEAWGTRAGGAAWRALKACRMGRVVGHHRQHLGGED